MKRDELLQVRLTQDELLRVWTAALDAEKNLSDFVREALETALEGEAALKRARQPLEPTLAQRTEDA